MNLCVIALTTILNCVLLIAVPQGPISKEFIAKFLPNNPVIIEAGAHVGTDTVQFANMLPGARIYAFEPVPHIYQKLKHNTEQYKNVKCIDIALSNKTGNSIMYVSTGDIEGSSSLLKPKEHLKIDPAIKFPTTINVKTMTLDYWAKTNNVLYVDFLWLDMQGAEPKMLMASPKILRTVKVIYTEASLTEIYEGNIQYPKLKSWLISKGFTLVQEDRSSEKDGKFINVLFVRNK